MNSEEKVLEFDEIASNVFGPIYPVIASQIKGKTGVHQGVCIDIGCCGGHLGVEVAKITDMFVYLLDISPYALKTAEKRIESLDLISRMEPVLSDVHAIPFEDETIDLAVSRGSIWFWEDQVKAFMEIYRVLKKGGYAYIGGGFGNEELRREVFRKMEEREKNWAHKRKDFIKDNSPEKFARIAQDAGIAYYETINDESGMWILIKK